MRNASSHSHQLDVVIAVAIVNDHAVHWAVAFFGIINQGALIASAFHRVWEANVDHIVFCQRQQRQIGGRPEP